MSPLVLLASLTACTPDPGDAAPAGDPLTTAALIDATERMTRLGPRQVATPAEDLARLVVVDRFEQIALEVVEEPFRFDAWLPGTASVDLGGEARDVAALSPSPQTDLTARLTDDADDADDAILLMSSDDGTRAEHYIRATLAGAAAMIRITEDLDHDGGPLVEVGHTLEGARLASLAVDRPTGAWLRTAVGSEITVRIDPIEVPGHTSTNVVGRLEGTGSASGTVYVVAHYDSWHLSESAFDNALGVGALFQLAARLVQGPRPERDVVFLATAAEEQGLQGAIAWVDAHADAIGHNDVVLTLDLIWSGEGRFVVQATDPELRALALAAAADEGVEAVEGGEPGLGSDHFPFVMAGARAIWCGRWPDRHYHTHNDTLAWLDMHAAAAAVRSQWRVLAALAGTTP